jgi:ubiquinone/menaquinone biosynthesis C-methylase UbiE
MDDPKKRIGKYWSDMKKNSSNNNLILRWWQSPHIVQHINNSICGLNIPGASQGLLSLVKHKYDHLLPFKKGISVGGGSGQKEMQLLKQGIVNSFDIYELSHECIASGKKLAKQYSLTEKINFIHGDAFEMEKDPDKYNIVHWNNSLHHMPDVFQAVKWSKMVLKKGGLFYMDDFVGPSRFQWPDEQLKIGSKIRTIFKGTKYLKNPKKNTNATLPTKLLKPDPDVLKKVDPSEAADSERIIDAIYTYFPNAYVKPTGGVIYHLALSDILHNLDEEEDKYLLDLLMIIDEQCTQLGQTHYAIALATKE